MKLTYYGHSTLMMEIAGKKVLFDPFFTGNPFMEGFKPGTLKADYIFITHGHGDHTSDLVEVAQKTGALCVSSFEIATWLQRHGVNHVHAMNHGGPIDFGFARVRGVNAVHSSSFGDGSYAGNPMGFLFTTGEGNFYHAGDTALTMDMQLIPLWAKLDFSIFPIGGNFTMDPSDAIHAADFVQCNKVIGIHYNTWPVIAIDTEKAKADFAASGKTLILPGIPDTIELV